MLRTRGGELAEDDRGQDGDRADREVDVASHQQHGAGDGDDANDGDLQQNDMKVGDSQVAVAAGGEEGDDEDEGEEEPVALRPADDAAQALRGQATGGLSDRRRVLGHSVSSAHAACFTNALPETPRQVQGSC